MIDSIDALESVFAAGPLAKIKFERIPVPETDDSVFAAELRDLDPMAAWKAARALVDQTGRWPLLVDLQFSEPADSFELGLLEVALSRFPFEDESGRAQHPDAVIAASENIDVDAYLEQRARDADEFDDIDWMYEEIEAELGRRPEPSELDSAIVYKAHRIDRWAYDRALEEGNVGHNPHVPYSLFPPSQPVLILLPTASSAEALAWVSWFGAEGHNAETIAVLRQWQQKYGAELYANYLTMLEFAVAKPPTDPVDAWQLAAHHDLMAPSNLAGPGIPVRHYAKSLIGSDRWHLHERP